MKIERYKEEISKPLMELLVLADPDEEMVRSYISNAIIFVGKKDQFIIGVAVILIQDNHYELKNLAVLLEHQGKGYGKQLITEVKRFAKIEGGKYLDVCTGNSSLLQLALYQKCGFRLHALESDFFLRYPDPIFENGIQCLDLVRLRAELRD